MIGNANAQPTIGVRNLGVSTGFYGGVLGLKVVRESPYEVIYQSGQGRLSIYVTEYAGTNKATYVTWEVDDLEDEMARLYQNDVEFEQYDDIEGVVRDGDVHIMGEEKAAWFKDPDGNILCLHQIA